MARFVILRHEVGDEFHRTDQMHFDWMFETAASLRTWSTQPIQLDESMISVDAEPLADHRSLYLDFEGDIGGGRGTVSRVIGGDYRLIETSADRFGADLFWIDGKRQSHQRSLLIERRDEDSDGSWRLRLSE